MLVNPNSLRPYHTTSGPAEGPTCSEILAPPLNLSKLRLNTQRDLHQARDCMYLYSSTVCCVLCIFIYVI